MKRRRRKQEEKEKNEEKKKKLKRRKRVEEEWTLAECTRRQQKGKAGSISKWPRVTFRSPATADDVDRPSWNESLF